MINDTLLYPKDYKYTGTSLKGIRPPLFRVDSVLLELPYDGYNILLFDG